jgi:hypothetical protein
VIRLLTAVADDMESTAKSKYEVPIQDIVEQAVARLQSLLLKQKLYHAAVVKIHKSRGGDGSHSRMQRLQIRRIAVNQEGMFEDLRVIAEIVLLRRDDTPAGKLGMANIMQDIPERGRGAWAEVRLFLDMVAGELPRIVELLKQFETGKKTQASQEQVIEWLSLALRGVSGSGEEDDPVPAQPNEWHSIPPEQGQAGRYNSRKAALSMLRALQLQVVKQTERLWELKRTGQWDAAATQQWEFTRRLQAEVYNRVGTFYDPQAYDIPQRN